MKRTAFRVTERNDNNIENLMRLLMLILAQRGVSFIHREIKGVGSELIIIEAEEVLLTDIYEAEEFMDVCAESVSNLIELVNNPTFTTKVTIDYKLDVTITEEITL